MHYIFSTIIFIALSFIAFPAHAYIGPAIAFVSYLLGPVIAIIVAVAMILYFPVRAFLRKRKKKQHADEQKETTESDQSGRNQ